MILVHSELTGQIMDEKRKFTEWIIESPEIFTEYVQELNEQILGVEGRFVLSERDREIDLTKKADIIINPFSVDVNSRKILNKLYQELSGLSKEEKMYTKTMELFGTIQEYMLELEQCTSYILEFDRELDISSLFKAVNVRYEAENDSFLERIVRYMKVMMAALGIKLFIFVNLRSYLCDKEIRCLLQEAKYQDVSILFMENGERTCMEGVRRYIIDVDRCEIY